MPHRLILCLPTWLFLLPLTCPAQEKSSGKADGKKPTPEQVQFFESKVRPLLANNCFRCHGEELQKSKLRLDSLEAILHGGKRGPALVPGQPQQSWIIDAVNYRKGLEMPPNKKLNKQQTDILEQWVQMGAPWPGSSGIVQINPKNDEFKIAAKDRAYWAFKPVVRPQTPVVAGCNNPIDAFIRKQLENKGLSHNGPASRQGLIRRVYFDLIGLPPTPEEVEKFIHDKSPDAYEKLIDRLLAMPQYGERWGRHWLDVVRFAQTNGYERDSEKPLAWKYRDYVIKSLNEDKPYNQFILEQIAGDELPQVTDESIIATAFFRLGVWDDEPDDPKQAKYDELDDMLSTTSTAFLGLTVGCARCHDHKFDPIGQEDYYSMLAFLRNIQPYSIPPAKKGDLGTVFAKLKNGDMTLGVREFGPKAQPTHVLIRGSAATPGKLVQPQFVRVLCANDEAAKPKLPGPVPTIQSSGRRLALAQWLASKDNPLTARVLVNRLWHYHFGRGIVATPSDFGKTGMAPTHPELLDWLAAELVDGGWTMKRLHKLILLSETYCQSSQSKNAKAILADPDNTLLWRQNLKRLEAEAIRDAVLCVSGQLNLAMGGRGFFPNLPKEVLATQSMPGNGWGKSTKDEQHRRSVYIFIKRTLGVPFLEVFDGASPDSPTAKRTVTTIAPQALILLNSEFMQEQSLTCADRLLQGAAADPSAQIEQLFRLALSRSPSGKERKISLDFLAHTQPKVRLSLKNASAAEVYRQSLAQLCKVVMNLNEFVYID
jgi:hypothetical protein